MLRRFFKDESGLETVEYAVMGALILATTVGVLAGLGGKIQAEFTRLTNAIGGGGA